VILQSSLQALKHIPEIMSFAKLLSLTGLQVTVQNLL
jgi:hypothetical protein